MTPVILLSDGFIANGTEPWKLPGVDELPEIPVKFRTDPQGFQPYLRDPRTLARPWALPGTPGLEHRIGGLEKSDGAGNVSYHPDNHEKMVRLRAEKVGLIAEDVSEARPVGDSDPDGLLVIGWGSTYGAIASAVQRARGMGHRVSHVHLRYLNPLPRNLGDLLARYDRVLVPEVNLGQLAMLLQARYLKRVIPFNRVRGLPFRANDILEKIVAIAQESN
jgi:2-oxoglutarate ferredoxin oxidoreductase subunit alpha